MTRHKRNHRVMIGCKIGARDRATLMCTRDLIHDLESESVDRVLDQNAKKPKISRVFRQMVDQAHAFMDVLYAGVTGPRLCEAVQDAMLIDEDDVFDESRHMSASWNRDLAVMVNQEEEESFDRLKHRLEDYVSGMLLRRVNKKHVTADRNFPWSIDFRAQISNAEAMRAAVWLHRVAREWVVTSIEAGDAAYDRGSLTKSVEFEFMKMSSVQLDARVLDKLVEHYLEDEKT